VGGHKENCQNSLANAAKHCAREGAGTCSAQQELQAQQESKSNEVRVSLLVDEDRAPWVFPQRKIARKLCMSACKRPQVSSLTFVKIFPAADVVSKSCRPSSCSHPHNKAIECSANRFGPNPSSPKTKEELIVVVACQVPREHSNPRLHTLKAKKTKTKSARCRAVLICARSSVSPAFIATRRVETKKGGACYKSPPEQEDTRSSPSLSMELKFELNTRLTVSCVVAVASAYGLVTVLIAFNSILLAFGNAVILLLILFVLFGWRELMGEFGKKRSATKQR